MHRAHDGREGLRVGAGLKRRVEGRGFTRCEG